MARSISLATLADLVKILDKDFVPGSSATMELLHADEYAFVERVDIADLCRPCRRDEICQAA